MKSKEVLQILKCTRATLSKYVKEEIIRTTKLPNGYYDYNEQDVYKMLNGNKPNQVCIYIPDTCYSNYIYSTQKYCNDNQYNINNIYIDNDSREKLIEVLDKIIEYSIKIIVTPRNLINKETLLILKHMCDKYNVLLIEVK